MRIISKFHDYYDVVQSQGQDRSLVFVREQQEYPQSHRERGCPAEFAKLVADFADQVPSPLELRKSSSTHSRVHVSPGIVLFAGRLHPFAEVSLTLKNSLSAEPPRFIYDFQELVALLAEHNYDLLEKDRSRYSYWRGTQAWSWEQFFGQSGSDKWLDQAITNRWAVLSWERHMDLLKVQPRLADLQFYRKLDAWQAYQELSMFFGNLAAPERVPVVIEDKYRIAQHGFDQWSFRKPPATR